MGRISFQQRTKHIARQCQFCGEENYDLLETHRIIPGQLNGKYVDKNVIVVCRNCHRRIHVGEIVIDGYYNSTQGSILHYFIDGEELWL